MHAHMHMLLASPGQLRYAMLATPPQTSTAPYPTILYYPYHTIPYHTIPYHTIPYHGNDVTKRWHGVGPD